MAGWIHQVQWGDVPTWTGALFAGGAALAALIQLRRQGKELVKVRDSLQDLQAERLDLELEPKRRAARLAKRRQAEQVRFERKNEPTQVRGGRAEQYPSDFLLVTNTSDDPIRTVYVFFGTEPAFKNGQVEEYGPVTGPVVTEWKLDQPIPALRPGETWCFTAPGNVSVTDGTTVVRFTDDHGVSWSADLVGHLDDVHDTSG